VPKPAVVPELTRQQLAELRDIDAKLGPYFENLLDRMQAQVRSGDRDNTARFREANSRLPAPAVGKPRVVFLGDSITDGWRLNEYFPDRDFINRGISGQITGEMLGRMKADVIDLKPQVMVVLAGTNDIARGVPVSTIQNNLVMIADLAQFHQIKLVFASILPISDYHKGTNPQNERSQQRPPRVITELNAWLLNFTKQRGFVYLNYFDALADSAGYLQAPLADDGLHPNAAGYRIMAPLALEAIAKAAPVAPPPARRGRK
jgi:lysophospholipase L1-like esterase